MNMIRKFLFALAAVASLWLVPTTSFASDVYMCAPEVAVGPSGPRRVTNPITNVSYSLNSSGCALIAVNDVGYFSTQGYVVWAPFGSIALSSSTSPMTFTLPAGGFITNVIINELSGGVVSSSGIRIGTTGTTSNIMAEVKITSNSLTVISSDVSIPVRAISTTSSTQMFLWGTFQSALINATIIYGLY